MAQQAATGLQAASPGAPTWTEDWLAVVAGLLVFVLSLGLATGHDLLGWAAAPKTWLQIGSSIRPISAAYAGYGHLALLIATYAFVLALMATGAALLQANVVRFAVAFTVVYWLSYLAWVLGNYAYIAVTTPAEMQRLGIGWSARLTGEAGYLIALLIGLAIANLLPGFARWLGDAARPELYIKTAIAWAVRSASRPPSSSALPRPSCFAASRRSSRPT
jgi:hypothetical protein